MSEVDESSFVAVVATGSAQQTVPNTVVITETSRAAADIGSGKSAPTNICYYAIKWSFLAAVISTCILVAAKLWRPEADLGITAKEVWSLLIPVITGALGYLFGKSDH